ncbi:hypothetical protein VP1G_08758 [Cytospora mali]|uniref:Rhodopsin domain-containing protein n=1 Tax=Cytospora mali TaxID=578113 RepID=A0A194VCU7_CYTMA|nr:hypothetical protein VP1G_08758 [Valsa mali var. pyri (nom. inval.)]
MTIAVLPFSVLTISCILGSLNGIGVRAARLEAPDTEKYQVLGLMYFFLFEVFYCASIIPIKLSIALMLIRIAQNRKIYVYSQWAMMCLFFIADGGACIYIIFQCSPVSYAWNKSQEGSCLNPVGLADVYYATTAVNIATDWVTAILPIPLLWHVKLERSEKLSVGGILGLGIFASLAACIRLNYTINLTYADDYLFSISNIVIWGYGEIAVGMFCGSLATLRPLFRKMFRLGSLGSSGLKPTGPTNSPFPHNSRSAYGQISGHHGRDVELGNLGTSTKCQKGSGSSSNDMSTDIRASVSSESDSIEQILKDAQQQGLGGGKGIVVSRQVNIARS